MRTAGVWPENAVNLRDAFGKTSTKPRPGAARVNKEEGVAALQPIM